MTEEDLHRIKEAQLAAFGVQEKMPTKVLGRPLRLESRATVVVR